jgi:hypothetical protein
VPGDKPEDIYREVAKEALLDIKMRSERGTMGDRRAAHLWLRTIGDEPPRKFAKKIVIAKPYGGALKVTLEEVRAYFDDNIRKRRESGGLGWLPVRSSWRAAAPTPSTLPVAISATAALRGRCRYGPKDGQLRG